MTLQALFERGEAQPGAPGLRSLTVPSEEWYGIASDLSASETRLLALWAGGSAASVPRIHAVFVGVGRGLLLDVPLVDPEKPYPGIEDLFPAAGRMQRAIADLSGVRSTDPDTRPWLRHAAWPQEYRPLIDAPTPTSATCAPDSYPFVRVEGEGVHEIAVGPVHAGIIEPGHFRFSVVGEKVLRLEERLAYVHKGIEQRFSHLSLLEGHRLAARVSGDSAVAYSWAYCQALEGAAHVEVPPRAAWLRALYLELERIANHLGDLGALGNDAGFAFGLAQFSRLKEVLLRTHHEVFGARYLMDAIVPGGVRSDLDRIHIPKVLRCIEAIAAEVVRLQVIYDEHEGVRDRFNGAGRVTPELAARLGLIGLSGRASGQAYDLRVDLPCTPYPQLAPRKIGRPDGDVAARVAVRFEELQESCRLVQCILISLPEGADCIPVGLPSAGAVGVGLIEGWRGPVCVGLEAGPGGTIRRCHPHDPSWQNWPAIEHAVIGNIVPDFPLINKSFNLSYSGHDL